MPTTVVHARNVPEVGDHIHPHRFIGRPSKWGNPFKIGKDGNRAAVIEKYRAWVQTQPELMAELPQLKNNILVCFCKPLACHGDVLAELADAT